MSVELERVFGRPRAELEHELDDTRDTVRELHSLARSIVGTNASLERRAWRAFVVVDELARDVRLLELDGRRRGTPKPGERLPRGRRA